MATVDTVPNQVQSTNTVDSNPTSPTLNRSANTTSSQNISPIRRDDSGLLKAIWNYMLGSSSGNANNQQKNSASKKAENWTKKSMSRAIISKLPSTSSWISSLLLSRWDNTSGPKVDQIWTGTEMLSEDIQNFTAKHTLCVDMNMLLMEATPDTSANAEKATKSDVETKFHVFADLGYVILACMFHANFGNSITKYSLSLIFSIEHLHRYLLLHPVIEDRMFQLVSKLRALLNKNPRNVSTVFTTQLIEFTSNLEHMYKSYLLPPIVSNTIFFGNPISPENDFLSRAITSHLQTHGCTVVIGDDIKAVNSFVDSLSLFLINNNERSRSSHAVEGRAYVPDLVLQGVLAAAVPDEGIIHSMLPTTLIDLRQNLIKQTHPYHEYTVLRREYMNLEIEKLVNAKARENLWNTQEGLFRLVKGAAPFIENILMELFRLPHALREAFITQSMRSLIRKAVVLIKYVEAELIKAKSPNLEASIVKKIRFDLDLQQEADFTVLLGIAEKLSPGMYVALAGDPASIEAKFVELFESF